MVENLPLLNKEDLYTLISHYHSLLPFLKTQHHLQLSDILSCFTTLPKSLSNHLADPYLSILQLHFHSRYSGSSTFDFTRILPFPSFEPYHISLLDLLITNYDIKVSVFTNLSLFHKVTQMTLLRYKDNQIGEDQYISQMRSIMKASRHLEIENIKVINTVGKCLPQFDISRLLY